MFNLKINLTEKMKDGSTPDVDQMQFSQSESYKMMQK